MPVRTVRKPLIRPPTTPTSERERHRGDERHAVDLHHSAEGNGDEPAERADGDVHLADAKRHHLREADEEPDTEAPQHDVDVELGQEIRRQIGEHRASR